MYLLMVVALSGVEASKVLAVMASVFAILQAIKKAFPALGGWYAVALNVAISVVSILVIIPPDKFFSLETLTTAALALIAALGAAGIHGTYTNVISSNATAQTTSTTKATDDPYQIK